MLQVEKSFLEYLDEFNLETATPNQLEQFSFQILQNPPGKRSSKEIDILVKFAKDIEFIKEYVEDDLDTHRDFCQHLEYTTFPAHHIVFREGSMGTNFYIILKGTVNEYISSVTIDDEGNQTIESKLISELSLKSSFGEAAILEDQYKARTSTVVCKEDTIFAVLSRKAYKRILVLKHRRYLTSQALFLLKLPIFKNESEHVLKSWVHLFEKKHYKFKSVLYREGDSPDYVYLIRSGEVMCTKKLAIPIKVDESEMIQINGDGDASFFSFKEKDKAYKNIKVALLGVKQIFGEEEAFIQFKREKSENKYDQNDVKIVQAIKEVEKDIKEAEKGRLYAIKPTREFTMTVMSQEAEIWSIPRKSFFTKMIASSIALETALSIMVANRKRIEARIMLIQKNHSENANLLVQSKPNILLSKRSCSQMSRRTPQPETSLVNQSFTRPATTTEPMLTESDEKLFNMRKLKVGKKEKSFGNIIKPEATNLNKSFNFQNFEKLDLSFQTAKADRSDFLVTEKRLRSSSNKKRKDNMLETSNMVFKQPKQGFDVKLFKMYETGLVGKKKEKDTSINETSRVGITDRISNTQQGHPKTVRRSEELLIKSIETKRTILHKLHGVVFGKNMPVSHWTDKESFITAKSKAGRLKAEIEAKYRKVEKIDQRGTDEDLRKTLRIIKDKFLKRVIKKVNNHEVKRGNLTDGEIETNDKKDDKSFSIKLLDRKHTLNQSYDFLDQLDSSASECSLESAQTPGKSKRGYSSDSNRVKTSIIQRILEEKERKKALGYQSSSLIPKFISFNKPKRIHKKPETNVENTLETSGRKFFRVTTPEKNRSRNESSQETENVEIKQSSNKTLALKDILQQVYKIKKVDS